MTYNEPTTVDLAAERPSLIQWPGKQACVTPRRWCSVCMYDFLSGIGPLRSGFYKLIMVHGSCMCDWRKQRPGVAATSETGAVPIYGLCSRSGRH